jgi:hypothetical protein
VFAFDGRAGQEVVGQSEGGPTYGDGYGFYVSGELYTVDGDHVGYVDFEPKGPNSCCAYPQELPVTGSYRLVIFGGVPADMTLTLFDTEHAPKQLLDEQGFIEYPSEEECKPDGNGGVSCSFSQGHSPLGGQDVVSVPTTMVAGSREVTATTAP